MAASEENKVKENMVSELYEKAKAAFELENYGYSIALFRNVLSIYPDFTKARHMYHLAIIHLQELRKNVLIHNIKSALPFIFFILKGKILCLMNEEIKSIHEFERAFELFPSAKWILFLSAQLAQKNELEDTAITIYDELSGFNFKPFECYKMMGLIFLKRKNFAMAQKSLNSAILLKPQDKDVLRAMKDLAALGTIEYGGWERQGDFTDKVKDKELAEKLKKVQSTIGKQTTEDLKIKDSDLDKELQEMLHRLKNQPDDALAIQKVRSLSLPHQKLLYIISTYESLISKIKPTDAMYRFLADMSGKAGLWQKAESLYDKAYELTQDLNILVLKLESRIRFIQMQLQKPSEASDENTLSKSELESLEQDTSIELIQKKMELHPNDTDLYFQLGQLFLKKGLQDAAITQFQKSLESPKLRTQSLMALGLCFKKKQLYDLSREQFEKALGHLTTMDTTKKHVLYMIGDISLRMNELDRAKSSFKQIYEVDISYKDVAIKLEMLYKNS